jgi:hypothetical protein
MEPHGTHRFSSNGGEADDHAVALRRGEGDVLGPLVKPRVEEALQAPREKSFTNCQAETRMVRSTAYGDPTVALVEGQY